MTAPEPDLMTTCPVDIEELAAFIDGRLSPERHAQVIEHLDTCLDCRDIVMTADQVAIAEGQQPPNVVRGRFWTRVIFPAAAAAAIVAWLFIGPLNKSGMERLVAASESLSERPVAGRFSGDFPYKGHSVKRGGPEAREEHAMLEVAADVANVSENASPQKLHAAGVAWLHITDEENNNRKFAVQLLEKAAEKRPDDAAILTDLSAAYYANGQRPLALKTAERALAVKETPAALWNRAVALEGLERDNEARATWNRYLQVDSDSAWAEYVKEKLKSE